MKEIFLKKVKIAFSILRQPLCSKYIEWEDHFPPSLVYFWVNNYLFITQFTAYIFDIFPRNPFARPNSQAKEIVTKNQISI